MLNIELIDRTNASFYYQSQYFDLINYMGVWKIHFKELKIVFVEEFFWKVKP